MYTLNEMKINYFKLYRTMQSENDFAAIVKWHNSQPTILVNLVITDEFSVI